MIRFAKTFALLLSALSCIPAALAQTPGSVAFNTTLVSVNGKWGTKHYVVAWVTKEDGTFIKTLWKQGKTSWTSSEWTTNCPTWNTARGGTNGSTVLDGYTSATAANYTDAANNPIDPVWNCQDAAGALMPDGNYKFWVQTGHSDSAGPVTTNGLLWTKRTTAFSTTFTNTSSFTNMSIAWTPTLPEIAVEQPVGTNLVDGSATLNCGSVNQGSSSGALTVTVKNTGAAALTGLVITKNGTNATDFTVSTPVTSVAAGGSTTFTVTFAPGGAGTRTAAIHLASNDADENPFDINLTGTGVAVPEIAIEQPVGTNLIDGSANVNFGSIDLGGSSSAVTFTVKNTGTAALTSLALTKDGAHAADFTLSSVATSVAASSSTTFTVTFTPGGIGTRTAAIHLASNDANESPFDITLTGTGGAGPEIAVEHPVGTDLGDGTASVNCGSSTLGTPAAAVTVTLKNPGTASLTGLVLTKDGANAADFTLSSLAATSLAPAGNLSLTVTFSPSAAGPRTAAIHLASNDSDENPFDITLTGTGVVPEIAVEHPAGTQLTDGSATLACGTANVGQPASALVITVKNLGTADLTGLVINKDGPEAADFAVGTLGATVLAPGASTTFSVTFTPGAGGSRNAAVHLTSNDSDESPFDISLTGTGVVQLFTPGTATLAATLGPIWGIDYWWAAWVTKDDGTFIKTLHVRGNLAEGVWDPHWNDHCTAWYAARNGSTALDGYTAATATTYAAPDNPLALTWNGRDAANNVMPDGTYKLWVQYSEDDEAGPGPVTTNGLTLVKGTSASTTNPPAQGTNFTNLAVVWTPALSAYDTWAVAAGLGAGADPAATPKSDGVTNLEKYAFNMDGTNADVRRLAVGAGGLAGLPGTVTDAGPVLRLEYIRRKASTNPGVSYTAQFGSDFAGWTPVTGTATSIDPTWERVVVIDTPPLGSTQRFGRVMVSQP